MKRWVIMCLFALGAGCGDNPEEPLIPGVPLTMDELMNPAACKDCHPKHYEEWSGSMHAYAAEDPVFRAMNARGQRETDNALGGFCIGCHAPLAVALGLTSDGTNLDDVPAHLRGITCYFCHQVTEVPGTHNNPLTVARDDVMRGGIADPVANRAHGAAYSPLHDRNRIESASLCGACHDIVTPKGVELERTFQEWKGTLYAKEGSAESLTCGACHMDGSDGVAADAPGVRARRVHSHMMPGADVALTKFPQREAQLAAVQRMLDTTVISDVCVYPKADGTQILVSLENIAAGHSWPSGAAQDRRAWVELIAYEGDTALLESGVVPDGVALADHEDPGRWELGETICGDDGTPVHMFWEAASVCDSALLPGPTAATPLDPDWEDTHGFKEYFVGPGTVDRVTLRVRLRPMKLDVLDDLIQSGDLDPAIRDAMPTFTLEAASLEWTPALDRACVLPPN